jgi:tetratricopeptide (TPR) repeat protein
MPASKQKKDRDARPEPGQTTSPRKARTDAWIVVALVVATLVAFAPAYRAGFIGLDDPDYVILNPWVNSGLSAKNFGWACTTFYQSNWHPLTWLALQLDATLWRTANGELNPLGFHLANIFLHAANCVLAFLALRALTGDRWRSAVVAALFALHPLRVESVAWVSERKDVLSLFFGLAALLAYARYARSNSRRAYTAAVALLALSLLSKPMFVTLPCLFLVLDWWPLGRAQSTADWRRLVVEKLPLFALCLASSIVTFVVQQQGGSVRGLQSLSTASRMANAVVAYVSYLGMTAWPINLAPYYLYREQGWGLSRVALSTFLIALLTVLAIRQRRSQPYLLSGWLWYVGTLVPVIGLIQVGDQAYADRYTYFPSLGLLVAVVWLVADLGFARQPNLSIAAVAVAAAFLGILTWRQTSFWCDDLILWPHTLEVTGPNMIAYNNIGVTLEKRNGNVDEAWPYYVKAVKSRPGYGRSHFNLARALRSKGQTNDAVEHYRQAIHADPRLVDAYNDLAGILAKDGKHEGAERLFRAALKLDPDSSLVRGNLAWLLDIRGKSEEALTEYRKTLRANPNDVNVNIRLGILLGKRGEIEPALQHLRRAVALKPDSASAQLNCGIAIDKLGYTKEAIPYFQRAVRLDANDMKSRLRLATALAHLGDTAGAAAQYAEAARIDPEWQTFMLRQAWFQATAADRVDRDAQESVWAAECVYFAAQPPSAACLDTLAAAYAEAGRFTDAVATAEKALAAADKPDLRASIGGRLALYREHKPFRDTRPKSEPTKPSSPTADTQ